MAMLNPWGTWGDPASYAQALADAQEGGQMASRAFRAMNPGWDNTGGSYMPGTWRVGSENPFAGVRAQYDPTIGYYVTDPVYRQATGYDPNSQDFLGKVGVPLVAAGMGAIGPLSGAFGGAGGIESSAGGDLLGGGGNDLLGNGVMETGAFDMGGSAGTGLEYGMQAGPATSTGFTVGPGMTTADAAAAAAGSGGLPSSIRNAISGNGFTIPGTDITIPGNVAAGVLQGGLGLLGANQQANAIENVANQQAAIGGPYRDLLMQSYQPGFNLWNQPGYEGAFNQAADSAARAVSAKSGNPFGNPGAMGEIQNYLMNSSYLPALSNYRGGLMQAGGMGLNTSGQASLMGAQQAGSGLDALGYGLSTAINPQPSINDLLKSLGGGQQFKLSYGY